MIYLECQKKFWGWANHKSTVQSEIIDDRFLETDRFCSKGVKRNFVTENSIF